MVRALVTASLILTCVTSLRAETKYWTEILNKWPYSVGSSDGVTVAVALRGGAMIDVEVIAFNDTSKSLRIVSGKIRPLAVRLQGANVRQSPLRRWEYRDPGYTVSGGTSISGARSPGMGPSPVLTRVGKAFDSVDRVPVSEYEPTKEQVVGSKPVSGYVYPYSPRSSHKGSSTVVVKPGRVGWKAIVFEKRLADWYEVEVTVAGKEFHFKFSKSEADHQPDNDRLP